MYNIQRRLFLKTGPRDRIQLFWKKWIILVLKYEFYLVAQSLFSSSSFSVFDAGERMLFTSCAYVKSPIWWFWVMSGFFQSFRSRGALPLSRLCLMYFSFIYIEGAFSQSWKHYFALIFSSLKLVWIYCKVTGGWKHAFLAERGRRSLECWGGECWRGWPPGGRGSRRSGSLTSQNQS